MTSATSSPFSASLTQYTITVLLVDDQPMVAEAVRRMLAPEKDIVFHYCQEPARAIPMAAEISPTIILQDLVMPDIDGLTLVRFYRSHPKLKDVPLIVLSSREEAITKADAFATGANDYLVKLPDPIELVARIRYHSNGYINLLQRNEAYDALLKSQQALAAELSHAAEYVISLLPAPLTEGGIRTRWRYVPSAQLGGDTFGYHWIDDEHFSMYLLDVCGHGVGAALLSVSAVNVLRSRSLLKTDFRVPHEVLGALNDIYQMEQHNNLYFTMWYGVFNRKTRVLSFCSAAHPPAILIPASGQQQELKSQNVMIGGLSGVSFQSASIVIEPPAKLYIFSDGIYEVTRPDGSQWTAQEMKEYIASSATDSGDEIDALYKHVQEMHGEPVLEDDFSLLRIAFM